MDRLKDILMGWGPADPQNILKHFGFHQGALNFIKHLVFKSRQSTENVPMKH